MLKPKSVTRIDTDIGTDRQTHIKQNITCPLTQVKIGNYWYIGCAIVFRLHSLCLAEMNGSVQTPSPSLHFGWYIVIHH